MKETSWVRSKTEMSAEQGIQIMSEESGGGLHIDGDWKTEAAGEKKRLMEQEATEAASKSERPDVSSGLMELVNLLAMQAAVGLGGYKGPGGEQIDPNLESAQHFLAMLEALREKTEGNLTDDEKRALEGVLYELRMQYVQMAGGAAPTAPTETPE